MTAATDCLVIGAGVIGCTIALQLQRAGMSVCLLEATAPGAGASAANAGMVGANAVVPMVAPGFLRQLPALMLGAQRSVLLRPHALSAAADWLWQCWKMANPRQLQRSRDGLHHLHQHTLQEWRSLLGDEAWQRGFRTGSTLSQYPPGSENSAMNGIAATLRQQVQIETRLLPAEEISARLPGLNDRNGPMTAVDNTAAVQNPAGLLAELLAHFIAAGGRYQQRSVRGFTVRGGRVQQPIGGQDVLVAQHYILAAGSASVGLLPPSSLRLPLMAERGYHIMLQRTQPLFNTGTCVLHDAGDKRVITEMAEGIRVTGYVEYVSAERPARRACYDQLEQHFRRRFPGYVTRRIAEGYGHRPSTPDSLPYIGRHPAAANLICAFGHGHYGMSGAPATARLVRDLLLGHADAATLAPFCLRRFSPGHKESTR